LNLLRRGIVQGLAPVFEGVYTGVSHDLDPPINSVTQDARGLVWDGSNFWVGTRNGEVVFQFNSAGSYTGTSYTMTDDVPAMTEIHALGFDGTHYYLCARLLNIVYKYTSYGDAPILAIDTSGEMTACWGVCSDDEGFIWVMGTDKKLYKYNSSGAYQAESIDMSAQLTAATDNRIAFLQGHFWGMDDNDVYKFTKAGVYTGFSFDISAQSSQMRGGITSKDDNLWVGSRDFIFEYE